MTQEEGGKDQVDVVKEDQDKRDERPPGSPKQSSNPEGVMSAWFHANRINYMKAKKRALKRRGVSMPRDLALHEIWDLLPDVSITFFEILLHKFPLVFVTRVFFF